MNSQLRKYASFWSKYRPAVLHMLRASLSESQQYQFMKHELSSVEKKPKGGFEFSMIISKSRPLRPIGESEIARDLFNMLQTSETGSALIAKNRYEITLDKKQVLHICRQTLADAV